MTKKNILHMLSPQQNISPFDVNMACDAGYDLIIPYTNVNLSDIKSLVQDAIFSRSVAVFVTKSRALVTTLNSACWNGIVWIGVTINLWKKSRIWYGLWRRFQRVGA